MKKALLVAMAVLIGVVLLWPRSRTADREVMYRDVPWNIERLPDGATRIFRLVPGRSTLADALARFGKRVEAALFQQPGGELSLEAYYGSVSVGGLAGRMVLLLRVPRDELLGLREHSPKGRRLETGNARFEINPADGDRLLTAVIRGITYIPSVNLDEDLLVKRFGAPAERQASADGIVHLLYPDRGLEITVDPHGKEMLLYVDPRDFDWVRHGAASAAP